METRDCKRSNIVCQD